MALFNHFQNRIIKKWKSIFRSSPQEIKIQISAIKPVGLLQCAIGLARLCSKNRVLCLSASLLKTDYYARNYADCRYYAPDYTRRKTSPLPPPPLPVPLISYSSIPLRRRDSKCAFNISLMVELSWNESMDLI